MVGSKLCYNLYVLGVEHNGKWGEEEEQKTQRSGESVDQRDKWRAEPICQTSHTRIERG